MDIPRWQWALASIVGPLIRHRIKERYDRRMQRVESLMASVRDCKTRQSLEALLGPPRYAMEGHLYSSISADGSNVVYPDTVEVYETEGCTIELCFKNGKLSSMIVAASPTNWEVATGAITETATDHGG